MGKVPKPEHCLSFELLRHIRDERPTKAAFLTWHGPSSGCYYALKRADLIREVDGRLQLNPENLSDDGRVFHYKNQSLWLDLDMTEHICRGPDNSDSN